MIAKILKGRYSRSIDHAENVHEIVIDHLEDRVTVTVDEETGHLLVEFSKADRHDPLHEV